jgi:hypothetical protein
MAALKLREKSAGLDRMDAALRPALGAKLRGWQSSPGRSQSAKPTEDEQMVKRLGFLIAASLICMPLCAQAQGTPPQSGKRGGYAGTSSPGTTSPSSTKNLSGSPSRNSTATGQGRTEGAYGMTPQLQKELGISRQQ